MSPKVRKNVDCEAKISVIHSLQFVRKLENFTSFLWEFASIPTSWLLATTQPSFWKQNKKKVTYLIMYVITKCIQSAYGLDILIIIL